MENLRNMLQNYQNLEGLNLDLKFTYLYNNKNNMVFLLDG